MSAELVPARVVDHLKRLRLGTLADRLDVPGVDAMGRRLRLRPGPAGSSDG